MSKRTVMRWSAKRKQEVVLRLLRGESLNALNWETGQLASVLSGRRDEFLEGGVAAQKRRTDAPKTSHTGACAQACQAAGRRSHHGQGIAGDADRPARKRAPFSEAEVKSVSQACSVSTRRVCGKARVCRGWLSPARRTMHGRSRRCGLVRSDAGAGGGRCGRMQN